MGVHKLTAGDGYTYLTRQVAAHDATDRGHRGLADYYAEKGESPGRWFGSGLSGVGLAVGSEITESQMRNLFGEGRHPNADRLESLALDAGATASEAARSGQLGLPFLRYVGHQPEFVRETARRYVAYNLAQGRHWRTPVPPEVRAQIRTKLGDEFFQREYARTPVDDRERGAFMARSTRQQTTAVAGYDLTFAPVKSVSALWAIADRTEAQEIEGAHHAAVEATLRWLEREVLFTRRGRGGIQQVRARGLIAGVFTHRDARSSDPHLHTHVAVSNKVQDESGRWLAIDGRVLFKANVCLAETYNTLLEAELVARLGVRFEDRRPGPDLDKRAVREIVGMDPRLATAWAKRRSAIEARRRELAVAFQIQHGRPPTEGEAATLAAQAWDQTRQAKHAPRSEADQRATWRAEAVAILESEHSVRRVVEQCLSPRPGPSGAATPSGEWVAAAAPQVVSRVAQDRATWQVWHLRAEALRQARSHGVTSDALERTVNEVVAIAIAEHCLGLNDPDPLLRPEQGVSQEAAASLAIPAALHRTESAAHGQEQVVSAYSLAGSRLYTSPAVVDAERRILAAATRTGGWAIDRDHVANAISNGPPPDAPAENGANPRLDAAQRGLVHDLATSGRAVQLALAPAGTGKTTAMRVLTLAWQNAGGTVIGLAPSAVAAHELGDRIQSNSGRGERLTGADSKGIRPSEAAPTTVHTDTLAKLVWHTRSSTAGDPVPTWMSAIGPRTMVLVDEAGMAATSDLAAAIDYVTSRGGQVRLIGDDRQLACVGASGVLRDIADQIGAVTLSDVHRFRNPDGTLNHAEAAATLALREGDPSAVAFYADRGRIHVGDLGACANQAYQAWRADRTGPGPTSDTILLAPTRELVAELNTRARNDRLTGLSPSQVGRVCALVDGTSASSGDLVITQKNDRRLLVSSTNWVKNGDRWTVQHVHPDGSLTVTHPRARTPVVLPAAYVAQHVHLGYASTVHGAQGLTTGTCHVVLTGEEDRNLLYVALSRGALANHLYLATVSTGDPHNLIRPEALIPPTAIDRFAQMVARDGSPVSATTALRTLRHPHQLLHDLAARYHDALTTGAENVIGAAGMTKIDAHATNLTTELTDAAAWPTLRSHLALLALQGHNPLTLLTTATHLAPLTGARDCAAVVDARLHDLTGSTTTPRPDDAGASDASDDDQPLRPGGPPEGPVPWLPGIPVELATAPDWGPFLTRYHQQVCDQVASVRRVVRGWDPTTVPAWAAPFAEQVHADLLSDVAVWRAVAGVDDGDLRPTGPPAVGKPRNHQLALDHAVRHARPSYPFTTRNWYEQLPDAVRADPWIIPLCYRVARLERAGLPVLRLLDDALDPDTSSVASSPTSTGSDCLAGAVRPLPDEYPAAALWWRLVHHLGPATNHAGANQHSLLDPPWTPLLSGLVGADKATYLRGTPAWPTLVAAIDEATHHHGWSIHDLLAAAVQSLPPHGLDGAETADALALQVTHLCERPHPDRQGHRHKALDQTQWLPEPDPQAPVPGDEPRSTFNDHPWGPTADEAAAGGPPKTPSHFPDLPRLPDTDGTYQDDLGAIRAPHQFDPPLLWEPSTRASPVAARGLPRDLGQTSADRLRHLNREAMDFFASCYPRSWAPAYLRERLGTDLAHHPGYRVGYAPGTGQSLMRHLLHRGAALPELYDAGLITRRELKDGTLTYLDFFRDRLVLAIRADPGSETGKDDIVAFVGRRNPTKTDADHAGPKYLNTRTTTIFLKGQALYGFVEGRELLAGGALPVLVEGPLDAIAVTVASDGAAAGIAPMGTALTQQQVALLRSHVKTTDDHRRHVAVATDADAAGWAAAQKAFWHLTTADIEPQLISMPTGLDPADLLHARGPQAVTAALQNRVPLGDTMLKALLRGAPSWSETTTRQELILHTARLLGAQGADLWLPTIERLRTQLCIAPGLLEYQTVTESLNRDRDPVGYAQARIDEISSATRPTSRPASRPRTPTPTAASGSPTPSGPATAPPETQTRPSSITM